MLVLAAQFPDLGSFLDDGLDAGPELVVAIVEALGTQARDPDWTDAITVCAIARRTKARLR